MCDALRLRAVCNCFLARRPTKKETPKKHIFLDFFDGSFLRYTPHKGAFTGKFQASNNFYGLGRTCGHMCRSAQL